MGKRGQISIEYMIILGVLLIAIIPLFYYSYDKVNYEIKITQADDAVSTVAKAADIVYSLGPGAKRYVEITIPKGVKNSYLNSSEVVLVLSSRAGDNHIYARSIATLIGELPTDRGTYRVPVEALDDGRVLVGGANDTAPPTVVWKYPSGRLEVQDITLEATTDENAACRYDYSDSTFSSMSYYMEGSLITHTAGLGLLASDNYTYYIRCRDNSGNTMNISAVINFSLIINQSAENAPTINIEGPADGILKNFNLIKFTYNVSSVAYGISYCELQIHGLIDGGGVYNQLVIDDSIIENVSRSITTSLPKGNHTWYINCTDDSPALNEAHSEIRSLRVNATYDEAFINSCSGWCGWQGFSVGVCRQNIPKCNDNCGLPYSESHDCYAGANVSETYCTGGDQSDTCCCEV